MGAFVVTKTIFAVALILSEVFVICLTGEHLNYKVSIYVRSCRSHIYNCLILYNYSAMMKYMASFLCNNILIYCNVQYKYYLKQILFKINMFLINNIITSEIYYNVF